MQPCLIHDNLCNDNTGGFNLQHEDDCGSYCRRLICFMITHTQCRVREKMNLAAMTSLSRVLYDHSLFSYLVCCLC
jgi:hypothetical protein